MNADPTNLSFFYIGKCFILLEYYKCIGLLKKVYFNVRFFYRVIYGKGMNLSALHPSYG